MAVDITALAWIAGISLLLPLVLVGSLFVKYREERKGMIVLFGIGAGLYAAMQWGVKEHGLTWLFNHTDLTSFMNAHYIPYLLLVAFAGAVLAVLPELLVIRFLMKKKVSFVKAVGFGLGYGMMESVMLVGYPGIVTIFHLTKDTEYELNTTTGELFLSGYERFLIMLIEVGMIVALVYFIEQNTAVRGCLLKIFCQTMVAFLPGFFIAFTTKNYYKVYDRPVALVLVYIVLTAAGISAAVVLNSLKYSLSD